MHHLPGDFFLDLLGDLRIFLEVQPGLFFALAELHVAVAEPGAGAADDFLLHAQVEDVAFVADAVGVHHVELGDAERRGDLVLDDLGPHALADDLFAFLELADAADVDAAGGVELEARPPGVVSGLPNMTPIFSRIWLMKITDGLALGDRGR